MRLYTLGHSTRTTEELLAILEAHGVTSLVDVRRFPMSRRHPHLGRNRLAPALEEHGIAYHFEGETLGGRRSVPSGSKAHEALRNAGFRGYAHHMHTPAYAEGIERLLPLAEARPTAILCAERFFGSCHRKMIADDLVALRGWEVVHLLDEERMQAHVPAPEARVEGGRLWYDHG